MILSNFSKFKILPKLLCQSEDLPLDRLELTIKMDS